MKFIPILIFITIHATLSGQSNSFEPITIGKKITIASKALDEDRIIYIYEPNDFEQIENLPVIYVLDGYSQFNQTATAIDYLSAVSQGNDRLPPSIVVGITNPNRDFELTPIKGQIGNDPSTVENTGGGEVFLEYITSELVPYIDNKYQTCGHRTLIGHSLGGLLVFQALLEKSTYFDNYLVIDPALGFSERTYLNEILDSLRTADFSAHHVFVASANNRPTSMTAEEFENDTDRFLDLIDKPNFEFRDYEASEDWKINISTKYYANENHFSVPFTATYDAIKYFYDYYPFQKVTDFCHRSHASEDDLLDQLKVHFQIVSKNIGCEIKPLEPYLNVWAWGLAMSDRKDLAIELFEYNIELYPNRNTVYSNYGYYLHRNGKKKEALILFEKSLKLKDDTNISKLIIDITNELTEGSER